ncbi:TTC7B isoform 13, partial [Pongo abelii]
LQSLCRGPDEALLTCKHMLQIWKSCYNLTNPSDSGRGSSLLDRTIADRRQLNTITLPDFSDPETGSIHATSVAASRVEQALSEVASSLQSSAPKQGPLHPWMTLAQIWLHAGPDPSPAGPLQSGGEDPPRRGAGELDSPRGLERAGRGPPSSGQRRGSHRVLPDSLGAGGQQPRCALHHHPPRALSRRLPASPAAQASEALPGTRAYPIAPRG